jgi:hypothetical protein
MTPNANVKALTANRLRDGEVVFWRDGAWVERFPDAHMFADEAEAEPALATARGQATVIVDPYLIDVRFEGDAPVPIAFRERVRALGPTIHPDMGKQTEGGPIIDAIQHASGVGRSAGRLGLIKKK